MPLVPPPESGEIQQQITTLGQTLRAELAALVKELITAQTTQVAQQLTQHLTTLAQPPPSAPVQEGGLVGVPTA